MADGTPPGTNGGDGHVTASDRLNSWKEIATYLGKGVRTVQRWESQMGLPVRRLGREGGEIVYALRSEIDAWILNGGRSRESESPGEPARPPEVDATPPSARPSRPRWFWSVAALVALFGITMTVAERWTPAPKAALTNPVGAVCEAGALRAWDRDGETLWSVPLGIPCDRRLDTRITVDPALAQARIAVQDIDGDGSAEVLIVARSPSGSGDNLRVFNADGSSRFIHVPGRPVTYGKESYRGFNVYSLSLINEGDIRVSLWVTASHVPWFPTVLQQISPSGEVISEYWHNGHILTIRPVTMRGRPLLLVGGFNNERRGGSLALLDRSRASGTAPAENDKYRCMDCAQGEPEEFLVFPNADITQEATGGEGSASVTDAILTGQEDLVLTVHQIHTRFPGEAEIRTATINYTLSAADLTLRRLEVSGAYRAIHRMFEKVGRLDHPMGPEEEKALAAVVRWNGSRFVPLAQRLDESRVAPERRTPPGPAGS
jgi:hypothetical protein